MPDARYAPIRDYAAIGDCHGSALVFRVGSVDWCCLGRFDSDPALLRILEAEKGITFLSGRRASLRLSRFDRSARSAIAFSFGRILSLQPEEVR
jgi:GH15 family glucan-1,4-alpha-glucosidase